MNMELDIQFMLYFDKGNTLVDMKNICETFLSQLNEKTVSKFPPLRFILEVDVMKLLELFPELGNLLLKEPIKWQRHCNDILFACLKSSDNEVNQHVQLSQVAVNIRLKSLPHVLCKNKLRTYDGIVSFNGLLVNISNPSNYVYHTVWSCPEECEGNEVIIQYIPKFPPKCYLCRSTLFENSGLRHCGDKVEAVFKLENYLLPKKYIVVDDLIKKLKLGKTYSINAVVLRNITAVWCIEERIGHPAPMTSPVPPKIKELFIECDSKPWKFIYCLASGIGVHVCPSNCFINVKINLLLSVASVKANTMCGSTILHFLASGDDAGYVSQLMRQASLLADSNVLLGTSNCSVATTLIGASSGICVMALPLHVYSQKQIHSIISAIEASEIHDETRTIELKCAIWAHGMNFKKIVLYDIANVFGTVTRIGYSEYIDELADFALQTAIDMSETFKDKQILNDISIYMDMVGGIKVSIHEDTQNLVSNYFMAARREGAKSVTLGNLGALVATCTTCARLCRRPITNIDDAVFAIWLQVCGMPDPRLAPDEYLQTPSDVTQLQTIIQKFAYWLEQFTGIEIAY